MRAWRTLLCDRDGSETVGAASFDERGPSLQIVIAGIRADGSPFRASFRSSEQRIETAPRICPRQAAVSIAGASYRHPARPLGAVRRRIDPQDAGSILKTFWWEVRTENRRACRSTPQGNNGRKERSDSAVLSCALACDGVAGGAGGCGRGF